MSAKSRTVVARREHIPRELRAAADAAWAAGWRILHTGGQHLKWVPPAGQAVYTGSTPHGGRVTKNVVSELRRHGLSI